MKRISQLDRTTGETSIKCRLSIDDAGDSRIDTGLGFLDHLLQTLAKHSGWEIDLTCQGDTDVDDHHTVEDCAIALGRCIDEALGTRQGISRFGFAYVPLDEALVRAVVDLSGRPWAEIDLTFTRENVGDVATENIGHFLSSMAAEARLALHVDQIRGSNSHHIAEAAFKAVARSLAAAASIVGEDIPSTKGVLR